MTIDALVDIIAATAGKTIKKVHDASRPQGVRGRNSDNTRLRKILHWEPKISLRQGCEHTYRWIAERIAAENAEARQAAK